MKKTLLFGGLILLATILVLLKAVWTQDYDNTVYHHPPPNASDLRFHYKDVSWLHKLMFVRLQYFNCLDADNRIEFALAMGVGNHEDILFTGRSMVFAKIYYPDGKFEYRVSDYQGQNFIGSEADSSSRVINPQGEVMGEIVQHSEDHLEYQGHTRDGYFYWDMHYERLPPASPQAPKNAWYLWDKVPTRGIIPRAEVTYLAVMTRARVYGELRAGDKVYQIKNGNGYADLYWGTPNFAALTWTWLAYQGQTIDAHLYHNLNNNAGSLRLLVNREQELIFPRGEYSIVYPPHKEWHWHKESGMKIPRACIITAENENYKAQIQWEARKVAFVLMDIPFLNFLIRDALTYEMISDFNIRVWRKDQTPEGLQEIASESGRGFSDWTRRLGWFESQPQRTQAYRTKF